MGTILCATRGGEASVLTEEAAIKQAAAGGDEIVFFYVVDVEFMTHAKYTLRSDLVHEELQEMAEFLMAMAVERAQKKHVKARALVRHGDFVEELAQAVAEVDASLVVLGHPSDDEGLARLEELVDHLAEQTGVPVCILP